MERAAQSPTLNQIIHDYRTKLIDYQSEKEQLESQVQYQEKERDFPDIIGNSEAIMDLKDRIREDIDNNTYTYLSADSVSNILHNG